MKRMLPCQQTRSAIRRLGAEPVKAQANLKLEDPRILYFPVRHKEALHWDVSVVIGMRGAGKSLWTAALNNPGIRTIMAREWGVDLWNHLDVHVAFGQDLSEGGFPASSTLEELWRVMPSLDPVVLWKTVLFKRVVEEMGSCEAFMALTSWRARVEWVRDQVEISNGLLQRFDQEWSRRGRKLLVVWDALDLLADDWNRMRLLARGALRFTQTLRMTTSMRGKLFLRPDMYEDDDLWTFADSSKLKQSRVELSWSSVDLYGLLLQRLINDPDHGAEIRAGLGMPDGDPDPVRGYGLPGDFRTEERVNEAIHAMAGAYMGSNRRRGNTHTWIPNHLADAKGRVSPRSLLLAMGAAARVTGERFPAHPQPLHYEAIRTGVATASETRVDELAEDYPWIKPLVEALSGLLVPCPAEELTSRWDGTTLQRMKKAGKLPPRRFTSDPVRAGNPMALIDDLEELAVLWRISDGRINIPDIFRIQTGMKRKGGVPPVQ
ncbi:MAG: hypothetical protein G8237_08570 [Magnetococcales bacterium]|nr:hypothetical protein [Magnetococcales bacterium]